MQSPAPKRKKELRKKKQNNKKIGHFKVTFHVKVKAAGTSSLTAKSSHRIEKKFTEQISDKGI